MDKETLNKVTWVSFKDKNFLRRKIQSIKVDLGSFTVLDGKVHYVVIYLVILKLKQLYAIICTRCLKVKSYFGLRLCGSE